MNLTELLNKILEWIKRNSISETIESDIDEIFQDGLSLDRIEEIARENLLTFSQELIELYSWRNGIWQADYQCAEFYFFPNYSIYPLEEAIKMYDFLIEYQAWDSLYFPIFYSSDGQYFFCAQLLEKDTYESKVYFNSIESYQSIPKYPSLTAMVSDIFSRYTSGSYYIDDDGELREVGM